MVCWEGFGRKRSCPNLTYYPGICLKRMRKITKNLSQNSRSPGRDLNLGPPEYEAGVVRKRFKKSLCRSWFWREHSALEEHLIGRHLNARTRILFLYIARLQSTVVNTNTVNNYLMGLHTPPLSTS
jgi:hypothetical protein